ncbi:MAG: recombinase family protein [Clostridia bacterium]|nr:recombinase family protein [Clostridia bacterium]
MARKSKYQTVQADGLIEKEYSAGLYIRLSREDGDKVESESISSQKAILEKFVAENPSISLYDYYIDDGFSGTDFERPAFRRMIADVTARKINCVIVKDLSRFGRNYIEAGKYIETVFPLFSVRFISVNDNIDGTENPASLNSVIVPFKNIINDEYCRDISMKVRSALDIRRRQGKFIGSFAPYGYKKDLNDHNKLVVDDTAAQTVRFIFEKFLQGCGIMSITRILNERGVKNPSAYKAEKGYNCRAAGNTAGGLWCDSTVRRILTNELYIGNLIQKKNEVISYKIHRTKPVNEKNRITVENTHEAIISKTDFEKVKSLLKRDTRTSPKDTELSVFAGFIKCADCGHAMQKRTVKQPYKIYDYYVCPTYRKSRGKDCTKHAIRVDTLEETVLVFLNKYISIAVDFERLVEKIDKARRADGKSKRLHSELIAQKRELERAQKILTDLYPDYKCGLLSRESYLALKQKYEAEITRARENAEQLKAEIYSFENGFDRENEFIAVFKKFKGIKKLTRTIMVELVENIFIHEGGEIEIHLKCKDAFLAIEEFIGQNSNDENKSDESA